MEVKKPLISVIVPCFQVEFFLKTSIDSILNQTFKDFEIILVDDGSTDSTGEICDSYAEQYPNIRVIHKENGGPSEARNIALEHSNGEYISFIDSDDTVHPEFLNILYRTIKDTDSDISVCAYREIRETFTDYEPIGETETITYSGEDAVRDLVLTERMRNYSCNKLFKKSLFSDIRYPVGKLWEDIYTAYKLFAKSRRVTYTSAAMYYYLRRPGSITGNLNIRKVLDRYEMLSERYGNLKISHPDLIDALKTQLCVSSYNCWSFLMTYEEEMTAEEKHLVRECISYLDQNGKKQLKYWNVLKEEKGKIVWYFRCRPLLRFLIKHRRRKVKKHQKR